MSNRSAGTASADEMTAGPSGTDVNKPENDEASRGIPPVGRTTGFDRLE